MMKLPGLLGASGDKFPIGVYHQIRPYRLQPVVAYNDNLFVPPMRLIWTGRPADFMFTC